MKYTFILALAALTSLALAGDLIKADFETAGVNYTISGGGIEKTSDYFTRSYNSDAAAVHSDLSNVEGTYYLAGRDIHSVSGFNTPAVLNINPVNTAGKEGLQLSFSAAAYSSDQFESLSSGFGSDYIKAEYSFDGGNWVLLAQFTGSSAAGEGALSEDADLNGTGDSNALSSAFTDFTYNIPATGSSLSVRFSIYNGSGSEFIAVDNVRVSDSIIIASPQNLMTVSVTSSQAELSWDAVSGATSYRIYRSVDPYGTFIEVGTSATNGFTDTNVSAGNKYFYYVTASN